MRSRVQLGCKTPWIRARWAWALIGLVLALLVIGDLPVIHDHGASGLYDEDCPLARLATTTPRASVPAGPDPFLFACAPEAVLTAPRVVLASFRPAPFAPRAPPPAAPV